MRLPLSVILAVCCALGAAACASVRDASPGAAIVPDVPAHRRPGSASPIQHVVIIVQENRSFDNFFATFPGADGTTVGRLHDGRQIQLVKAPLNGYDVNHGYPDYVQAYDGGKMDGFDLLHWDGPSGLAGTYPYEYVDPEQIKPYWSMARQYVLADRMFQTHGGGSFTAHQDLIAGDTAIDPTYDLIDYPTNHIWGCDAWSGTVTSLVNAAGHEFANKGPFPCLSYPTLRDSLDGGGISWKYYTPPITDTVGALWSAFDAIAAVRHGPEWYSNVSSPETTVFGDISAGRLPHVSWVIPDSLNSDHPQSGGDTGPSWVASVVNAIGKSQYWNSTAIVIVWDDFGGWYDHVAPPQFGFGELGFRVPMIVVSPYARQGYVSHTHYEFASILRFVEDNWKLARVGHNDRRANSIEDVFDFTQPPRKFVRIKATYEGAYFLHRRPSGRPVDDQ
jgi:phospholipase C